MVNGNSRVLISGGGPVGLLCAWMLGRRGISVRVFDNNPGLQEDPRAATTHPATLDLLAKAAWPRTWPGSGWSRRSFSSGTARADEWSPISIIPFC